MVEQSFVLTSCRGILTQLLTMGGLPLPEGFAPVPSEHDLSPMFYSSSSVSLSSILPSFRSDGAYQHKYFDLGPFAENDWESMWRDMEQVGDNLGYLTSSILMYQQNDTSDSFYGNFPIDPAFEMLHTVFPEADKPYAVPDVLDTVALERWFRSETH